MKEIGFGQSRISSEGPCYVIAEIGHNHQGNLETALQMISGAASCGAQAVKFQKRDNRSLFTKKFYNRPYDNENSYGATYGEHREFLEFGHDEYKAMKKHAEENRVEFMSTAFDFKSVDFLEDLGIASYKIASADIVNTELLKYVARLRKPMFISTGGATLNDVRRGYETVLKHNDQICLLHCVAGYPTDYPFLNLKAIETLRKEFPDAIIGYSGHDNGILGAVIAYILGAKVVEKHFTINHSWKGTDHKFSLEPDGLRKQIRDLRRVDQSLGSGEKTIFDFEKEPIAKMSKGIYASRKLLVGTMISRDDICLKSPANGTAPYYFEWFLGKKLIVDLDEEDIISKEMVE